MRHATPTDDRRARLIALLRAIVLAAAAVAILPLPSMAAEGDPTDPPIVVTDPSDDDDEPDPTPEPTPEPTPQPPPIQKEFIYRSAAITRQYTNYWCVPAVTQSMWNLIEGVTNRTYARQKSLYRQIRKHNRYRYTTKGNDVQGWAWALRRFTGEDYQARAYASKSRAMAEIAEAIDRTGHPVGITINHGSHAWIVLGYKAQPSATDPDKRTLLGFYVSGPLGPNSRDPWRYRYVTMANFRRYFGKYHERTRKVIWEDKYVLVSD
ncbi:MAG TPA: hypothetical protein VIH00_02750 [Candidatus Limnocylindrales bacterium]